ncbi:hypothetical protein ABZY19_16580 [Streptomyces sp. NPDC006475]|uniref:hypothetical protein n=1 Tax=Streptomyces sp. NPDC006475 TaxID=3155719 RepID=UPI00339ED60B
MTFTFLAELPCAGGAAPGWRRADPLTGLAVTGTNGRCRAVRRECGSRGPVRVTGTAGRVAAEDAGPIPAIRVRRAAAAAVRSREVPPAAARPAERSDHP